MQISLFNIPISDNGVMLADCKKDLANSLKGKDMKELRWVTRGIFYCRVSAGFSVCATNKVSCNLTGKCFEIGNKNIPPNRYRSV